MSLHESIIKIRVALQESGIKKSGKNRFANFNYYELSDFLPILNKLMLKEKINDRFFISDVMAVLELIKGDERESYTIPFTLFPVPKNKNGQDSMQQIQYVGALNTYYKRYLYLNAFGITDGEVIDSMNNSILSQREDLISQDMVLEIESLISETNSDKDKLLRTFTVDRLNDLSMEHARQAKGLLLKKKDVQNAKNN
jgi:hypothetical protein